MMNSARLAWHDSYYIPKVDMGSEGPGQKKKPKAPKMPGQEYSRGWYQSVYEVDEETKRRYVVAQRPLMNGKDSERNKPDFFMKWDPLWRSKVNKAIRSLPQSLKSFGAIMYAPSHEFTAEDCEVVHEEVQSEFFRGIGKEALAKMSAKRIIRLKLLIYAAMRNHRDLVFGGESSLSGPVAISDFLHQMYAERIPSPHNWAAQWQPDWKVMQDILDQMERKALGPVSRVLSEIMEQEEAA